MEATQKKWLLTYILPAEVPDKGIDCRSQTGIFVLLIGVPVHWRSVKQVSTAVSSACAEIYALSDAVKSVRLYRYSW